MLPTILEVPSIMMLYINSNRISFDPILQFDRNSTLVRLRLRGIIYGGQGHFTCRYISKNGDVWFNDSMMTGQSCVPQGHLSEFTNAMDLHACIGRSALAVVYAVE
ncbi:hypothetical protein DFH09DRAFT_903839 [Mycena vulgaris]|nr:hypothetical protein DFH09DRAFT_903839 [Mycena vulgaris]